MAPRTPSEAAGLALADDVGLPGGALSSFSGPPVLPVFLTLSFPRYTWLSRASWVSYLLLQMDTHMSL